MERLPVLVAAVFMISAVAFAATAAAGNPPTSTDMLKFFTGAQSPHDQLDLGRW